jgi:Tfp pilus assembly protein PilN
MNGYVAQINLASQPFGRERAQTVLLGTVCAVLSVSLLIWAYLIVHQHQKAAVLRTRINQERSALTQVQREQSQFENVIGRPKNAGVFSKSVFDNELIARRAVSWTKVFEDLEKVMPADVRLVSLRLPQVVAENDGGTNHIQLDMTVGTQDPRSLLALLNRLQASPLFGATTMLSEQAPSQNDPYFRYRVSVPYAQKF